MSITNHLSDAFPGVQHNYNQIQPAKSIQRKGVAHIPSSFLLLPYLQNKNPVIPQLQSYSQPTGNSLPEAREKKNNG